MAENGPEISYDTAYIVFFISKNGQNQTYGKND